MAARHRLQLRNNVHCNSLHGSTTRVRAVRLRAVRRRAYLYMSGRGKVYLSLRRKCLNERDAAVRWHENVRPYNRVCVKGSYSLVRLAMPHGQERERRYSRRQMVSIFSRWERTTDSTQRPQQCGGREGRASLPYFARTKRLLGGLFPEKFYCRNVCASRVISKREL